MPDDDVLGQVVAGFRVESAIGRGGAGRVYLAREESSGKPVALKILQPGLFPTEEFQKRFDREMKISQELKHPHIVPIYSWGRLGEGRYIAMRLVQGVTLSDFFRADAPWRKLLVVIRQVSDALGACHREKIVHRDLKPPNIMVEYDHAYLMDFGLARHTSGDTISSPQFVLGTPSYMSPEQVRGDRVSPASDVFSMGIILFEIATRRQPFTHDIDPDDLITYKGTAKVMDRISKVQVPPLPASVPEPVAKIIRRCMEPDPARRFADGAALAAAVGAVLDSGAAFLDQRPVAADFREIPQLNWVNAATVSRERSSLSVWIAMIWCAAAALAALMIAWLFLRK